VIAWSRSARVGGELLPKTLVICHHTIGFLWEA
jgi:hypothetical protein